jgi:hypothetical protein
MREINAHKILVGKPQGKEATSETGIGERIIVKWNLNECDMGGV